MITFSDEKAVIMNFLLMSSSKWWDVSNWASDGLWENPKRWWTKTKVRRCVPRGGSTGRESEGANHFRPLWGKPPQDRETNQSLSHLYEGERERHNYTTTTEVVSVASQLFRRDAARCCRAVAEPWVRPRGARAREILITLIPQHMHLIILSFN